MKNQGLFSTLFIDEIKEDIDLDDMGQGRMATLAQAWRECNQGSIEDLWESFIKQAVGYLEFVPPSAPTTPGIFPLYEDWGFMNCISVLCLVDPKGDLDDMRVGHFWIGKLIAVLKKRNLNWGILTDGRQWRLYSLKTAKPYEDYVELPLVDALKSSDEPEYALFEHFFYRDVFVPEPPDEGESDAAEESATIKGLYKCRLDRDRERSEEILEEDVKSPLLYQVDEVLQYICNGLIADTRRKGDEYTEDERQEIFESAVKLLYRCLFLFYAESRHLLPSDTEKTEAYEEGFSIYALCREAHNFHWGKRSDHGEYDLWQHLKGLTSAVNDGDSEYGIMGYDGGLFDDEKETFLGNHRLRNDFIARALYLLAYVEPYNSNPEEEYEIPYEDLEIRHLGELYENILEFNVLLAEMDMVRVQTNKGPKILPRTEVEQLASDRVIKRGDVYFGETALERKQTGSYYTPEPLVHFLNQKVIIQPLRERFEADFRDRFGQFLETATTGFDNSTRNGAVQSAVALVERFVSGIILDFKACDPAMGSGHFLVNAANQMTDLIVEFLTEIPGSEDFESKIDCEPNYWRRLITRHCLYGVDLNPLAVHLARLSLWLNSFACEHKLTFLDHQLRCGNSLIGIRSIKQLEEMPKRRRDGKGKKSLQTLLFDYDDLTNILAEAARGVSSITKIDEDDTDSQRAIIEEVEENTSSLHQLADLYTFFLMDTTIPQDKYKAIFESLARGKSINDPDHAEIWKMVEISSDGHCFFHWPLEFPGVFGNVGRLGFSAVIGNPPWDVIKANSLEFFSGYDPYFRTYKKQQADRISRDLLRNRQSIADKWKAYCDRIQAQNFYFREPLCYDALGNGDLNTFKIFLEQFFKLSQETGIIGIIVPSGIYTDQGCKPLRELFFNQSCIKFLYCFENREAIFNIHRSFKFVIFAAQKGEKTEHFRSAFMKLDPRRLPEIETNALDMNIEQIERFSPSTLSIFEFNSQIEVDISRKIYTEHSLLGDKVDQNLWHIDFHREFHMSDDSDIFNSNGLGLPLYEGKCIWQFDSHFCPPTYNVDESLGRKRILRKKLDKGQTLDYQKYRLVYRKIARNTDERTLISSIIAEDTFTGENLTTCKDLFDEGTLLFVCGIFNSLTQDFILRLRVTAAVNMYHIQQVPLPRLKTDDHIRNCIIARSARLLCTHSDYGLLWNRAFAVDWTSSSFWYPALGGMDYGPEHEREIRYQLSDSAKILPPEWNPECGVYDRLPDRRDSGTRAQFRAEIDAYIAHLYGLNRDDFVYILDSFPVLEKKEKKLFGEFMSKRKCLEEYDRLKPVIEGMK
jgi:hypothetical protein